MRLGSSPRNSAWKTGAIGQQIGNPLRVELPRIKLQQRRSDFQAQLRGIQLVARGEQNVNSMAELPRIGCRWPG